LARRYVEDKELALSEVAHLLGFSELSAFSQWFRAECDCSPTSWHGCADTHSGHLRRRHGTRLSGNWSMAAVVLCA
jgi:AraC-like DNA-binding protein